MGDRMNTKNIKRINENVLDTVNQSEVDQACRQIDEIIALPVKRMKTYYEEHFSKLNPIVQGLLEYYLDPYRIDESSLEVSNNDAHRIMSYYNYHPIISRLPESKIDFNRDEFLYHKNFI